MKLYGNDKQDIFVNVSAAIATKKFFRFMPCIIFMQDYRRNVVM